MLYSRILRAFFRDFNLTNEFFHVKYHSIDQFLCSNKYPGTYR